MQKSHFSSMEKVNFRTKIISRHLNQETPSPNLLLQSIPCLSYNPPELLEPSAIFDTKEMRKLMDGHNFVEKDWLFGLMLQSNLFNPIERGGKVFVSPDYNQSKEQQREITMKRIGYLLEHGVFKKWLTGKGHEDELRKLGLLDCLGIYDHSLAIKVGVHFFLWGGAIQFFGTKRHHDKWLKDTEDYVIKGCFSMTELGHGSNVRGIETVTTYDSSTGEFVINTPCESAQKYWIGGAANHATHTIVFSQLIIDGENQGVHAFIAQIRDENGDICPNIRIADCGHKIGLNGVDNGRIWFDNVRVPRENLLNSVADVSPDGKYLTAIKDPDQRFAAFLSPLTSGRVTIAASAVYSAKIGMATAIRYSLTRRAFPATPNGPEVLILDYPSHQRRLLPLLAKTYAMSFAANQLKMMYVKRTPEMNKVIHVVSSAFKAAASWHNMRTLQECREACGGQGLKTENRIGQLKGEYDVQSTFEGDNNVLMQQVSKALFGEYVAAKRSKKPFKGLGLEHMNTSLPVIPSQLTSSTMRQALFQNDIFCLRERDLLERFAAEVSQCQAQGKSKEYAFTLNYQLAEDLGRAFSDRAVLHTFLDAEASVTSGHLKNVLDLVRSMYVLVTLEEDAAFLRYGYLSMDNAAIVRKEVAKLCSELRPHALSLMQLEVAKITEDTLRSEGLKAMEACRTLSLELEKSKDRVASLEELVSKFQSGPVDSSESSVAAEGNSSNVEADKLKIELSTIQVEVSQLRAALEDSEIKYQEEYIQNTLQTRSAYELVERTKSESLQREAEWEGKLNEAKSEVEELKEKLMNVEAQLVDISDVNKGLSLHVEQMQSADKEFELAAQLKNSESVLGDLRENLLDKETELLSLMEENEQMKSEISKRESESTKVNNEALALVEEAKTAEREALMKLGDLTEEADKSSRKVTRVTEELNAAQAANSEIETQLRRLKVQCDQWRKAAEAAASMLSTGNNRKYVERTGSLDYHTIGGKLGSPLLDDLDDDSPKKKNNNMLKKLGFLLKKGQK